MIYWHVTVRTASLPLAHFVLLAWYKPIKLWVPAQNPLTGFRLAQLIRHLLLLVSSDCVFFGPCLWSLPLPNKHTQTNELLHQTHELPGFFWLFMLIVWSKHGLRKGCWAGNQSYTTPYQAGQVHLVNSTGAILHAKCQQFFFFLKWVYDTFCRQTFKWSVIF